jgi:hypothetical protein
MFGAVAPAVKGTRSGDFMQKVSPHEERLDAMVKKVAELGHVAFLSMENTNGLFVIPSQSNFAGGIRFGNAVTDNACATNLIRIDDNVMMDAILQKFSDCGTYTLALGNSHGTNGKGLTLSVKYLSAMRTLTVLIGSDLFGKAHSVEVPKLRFQLSSASAQFILSKGGIYGAVCRRGVGTA